MTKAILYKAAGTALPFLQWLPSVNRSTLRADCVAGLTGAIIVLPQGIAYAMIAGLPPEYGLYAAIVIPVVAALFGSSYHLVSGPTAAISVLVASVLAGMAAQGSAEYVALALSLTFLAGAFQLVFGVARLGALVNFISNTVIVGFTTGAALIIAVSQLGNIFGIQGGRGSGLEAVGRPLAEWPAQAVPSFLVFITTVVLALVVRRLRPGWPALLLTMLTVSAVGYAINLKAFGVPMVGAMPGGLPPPALPPLSPDVLRELVPGALAIAVVGLIEAVAIARAIALRSQQSLDGNQEFIGQGLSNIVGSFLSGYASSGSFTRSGANYDAGARTPLAAVLAAAFLAVIVVTVPAASSYLPIPVVAGIIVVIAWDLLNFRAIWQIVSSSRQEAVVFFATFLSAITISLEFAIGIGVVLSLVLYLRRTSHPRVVAVAPHPGRPFRGLRNASKHGLPQCPHLRVLRLEGSLFFGATENVKHALQDETRDCKNVLLVCSGVNFIDMTGAEMLAQESRRLASEGGGLYLAGLRDPARSLLQRGGYEAVIGTERIFGDPVTALAALAPDTRAAANCSCEGCCTLSSPDGVSEQTEGKVSERSGHAHGVAHRPVRRDGD